MTRIYKILPASEWAQAKTSGQFLGSAIDLADGFIHFSAAHQAAVTAAKYFAGKADLMILGMEEEAVGPGLKWEPSRGGDLFPHLYGPLAASAVDEARGLALGEDGVPTLGDLRP